MMNYRKNYITTVINYLAFVFVLIASAAYAKEINFQASVDTEVIYLGQSTQLQLQFQGSTDVPAPDIPAIDGFQARYAGPSTMMSIVNGRMSSSVTHIYRLVPLKTGKFKIGPSPFNTKGIHIHQTPLLSKSSTAHRMPGSPQSSIRNLQ